MIFQVIIDGLFFLVKLWFTLIVVLAGVAFVGWLAWIGLVWLINCTKYYLLYYQLINSASIGKEDQLQDMRYQLSSLKWKLNRGFAVIGEDLQLNFFEVLIFIVTIPLVSLWVLALALNKIFKWLRRKVHRTIVMLFVKNNLPCALLSNDEKLRNLATEINNKKNNK